MERRAALLIASSEYHDPDLARLVAPPNDVRALAEVLRDDSIGGFHEVKLLMDESSQAVRIAVADFFAEQKRNDLALFYFSGHGLKDDLNSGKLYLTATDTRRNRLRATGLAASFLLEEVEESKSRRIILILDCCHSGAFARGSKGTDDELDAVFKNMGYGRVVLTASNAVQLAYEDEQAEGKPVHSVFTKFLLEGLRTGAADLSQRGKISASDLYNYAKKQIDQLDSGKRQTPKIWDMDREGEELIIARSFFKPPTAAPQLGKCPSTYSPRPQAHYFVGREKQLAELRTELLDKTKVFVIVDGLAGMGKTLLAAKLADEMEAEFAGIFYSKCGKDTDLDQVLAELAYFLSGCSDQTLSGVIEYPAPPENKINFLLASLGLRNYLLIFDDVHELLNEELRIGNEGLCLLFSKLLETGHQSKILLVSRVRPALPRHSLCQSKNRLEQLDPESGVELLRLFGLDEEEEVLRRAWQLTGGHPLAMSLLAGMAEKMDLQLILADTHLFYSDTDVVSQLLRQFYTLLTAEEKQLLLNLSVLPHPADFGIIAHLEEKGQAVRLLSSLVEKNLLIYNKKAKQYRLHDLVREFSRAERRHYHAKLVAYYEQREFNPDKPSFEQVQQQLEAHYHAVQAGEIAKAAGLLAQIAEHLRKWGYLERCRTLLEETLAALEQWDSSKEHLLLRVDLLVEMGWLERSSAGLDKAVARCRQAEELLKVVPDEGREGRVCHALGKFFYEEALWKEAEQYFVRAFELQKVRRNTKELAKVVCNLYDLYWRVEEIEKIEKTSKEGIRICEEESDAENKGKILIEVLGKTFGIQRRWEHALAVYKESLRSRREDDLLGQALSLRKIGEVLRQQKQFDESLEKHKESFTLAQKAGDISSQVEALLSCGYTHRDNSDINKAIELYDQCVEITNQITDVSGRADLFYNLGGAYRDVGNLEKALEQFNEALRLRKESGNILGVADVFNRLGSFYSTKYSKLSAALKYYKDALEIKKSLGRSLGVETETNNIAFVYKHQGRFDEALALFKKLIWIRMNRSYDIAITYNHIGHIYYLKGNIKKSFLYFNKSLRIYKKNNRVGGISVTLSYLGEAYLALGNYEKALATLHESVNLKTVMSSKANPLTAIAEVYYRQGKLDAAKEKCEESLAISSQYGGKIQAGVTLHLLEPVMNFPVCC